MSTDPIRAALERLVSAYYDQCEGEYEERWPQFLDEPFAAARAALEAAPVGVPSDEELFSYDILRDAWNAQADDFNKWDQLCVDEIVWWAQKQSLARWGNLPAPQPVEVSDDAVFVLTRSLGMIAMEFAADSMKKSRPDEALRHMRSEARQVILEWLNALPLPTTTPAGQEGDK